MSTSTLKPPLKIIVKPDVTTDRVGGVDIPSAETLKSMHLSRYIIRVAEGKLTKVPAEKTLLPHAAPVLLGMHAAIRSRLRIAHPPS